MNSIEIFSEYPLAHHAYGVESTQPKKTTESLLEHIHQSKYSQVLSFHFDTLKIDDVRKIKEIQKEKTENGLLLIISFSVVRTEAQNALLKVLEEPAAGVCFILIFPQKNILLSTVLSRLEMVVGASDSIETVDGVIGLRMFIDGTLQERLDWIKKNTDKKKKDAWTKQDLLVFLDRLESWSAGASDRKKYYPDIIASKKALHVSGCSIKMILENLALQIM